LEGARCIDIGSGSGLVALGMKALGASYVAAADAIHHPAFDVAREITGLDVDYRLVGMEKLVEQSDWLHSFDVVVTSGLLYHLWSPFELVVACRKLLRRDGVLVMQSLCEINDPNACLFLNSERNLNGDPTTFFIPGVNAMKGMLKAACFDIIAQRNLVHLDKFVAVIGRAVGDSSQVSSRAPNLIKMHSSLKNDPTYNFGGYDFVELMEDCESSTVQVSEMSPMMKIDESQYECRWPFNPKFLSDPVGVKFR